MNLVYQYGLRPPTIGADMARRHLEAAHRYRNLLTEIEQGRRAALREAEAEDPALAGVDAAIAWMDAEARQLATAIKRARSAKRTRATPTATREQLAEVRARIKRAKRGRALYRAWWLLPRLRNARDAINERAKDLRRSLRRHRRYHTGEQLYHGTYCAVEDAAAAAGKMPLAEDPRFLRYSGEWRRDGAYRTGSGTLAAQVQGGETWEQLLSCTGSKAQIQHVGGRRYVLRLRQESTPTREPVWVEWPMVVHRPVPPEARVMHISVHCRTEAGDLGPRERWDVTLTLRLPDHERRRGGMAVAVDVGWRALPSGGLRVAYWVGEDGREGELALPPQLLAKLQYGDSIRGVRDELLDGLKRGLAQWIDALPHRPPFLRRVVPGLPHWRSPQRVHRLIRDWERWGGEIAPPPDPFPTPDEALAMLRAWQRRDDHLHAYEQGSRRRAQNARRDLYRCFAAELGGRYDVVVLEDFDKRSTAQRRADVADTEGVHLRHAQRLANTSGLCADLSSRFGQHGQVVKVDPAETTIECHVCGAPLAGDAADGIVQRCVDGHEWDQDRNASIVMLRRYRKGSGTPGRSRRARTETRWERAKRLRAEKEARMEAAREARDECAE